MVNKVDVCATQVASNVKFEKRHKRQNPPRRLISTTGFPAGRVWALRTPRRGGTDLIETETFEERLFLRGTSRLVRLLRAAELLLRRSKHFGGRCDLVVLLGVGLRAAVGAGALGALLDHVVACGRVRSRWRSARSCVQPPKLPL